MSMRMDSLCKCFFVKCRLRHLPCIYSISPSVYMVFSSLRAWDACGTVGQVCVHSSDFLALTYSCIQVVLSTTMAFLPEEVSTLDDSKYMEDCSENGLAIGTSVVTRQLTFADLQNCPSIWGGMVYNPSDLHNFMNTQGEILITFLTTRG